MADEETELNEETAAEDTEPASSVDAAAAAEPDVEAEAGAETAAEAEPEASAEPAEAAAEQAAPAAETADEAAAPGEKKKRRRLPRSERRQRPKRKRRPSGERKPIVRLPKPEGARGRRQERQGTVVSASMDKTIVVEVDVVKAHRRYKKVVRRSTRFHAHDEGNTAKVGDVVRIVETRPLSKLKRWRLVEVVEAAK
jgi:small subunit ribosomal protein S17